MSSDPIHSEATEAEPTAHRREIDRNIETIRLTLRGRWPVESARQDSLVALKALRDEIEHLRANQRSGRIIHGDA